jgi:flagellar basal-body rod protein FlgB
MFPALKPFRMISALFSDPQFQSLQALMDASVARHRALAGNIANVNTPGFKRSDISPEFQKELEKAIKSKDAEKIRSLTPKVQTDKDTPSLRLDGNNVNLEREMVEIAKNSTQYDVSATILLKRYQHLRMAITGKS